MIGTNKKRHGAIEVADPNLSGAGVEVEGAFFVNLGRGIRSGKDLSNKSKRSIRSLMKRLTSTTQPLSVSSMNFPDLVDMEAQSKVRESVKEKKVQKRYDEEFKRQAVELVIHSGKTQAQVARELGVSEYSLTLWKRAELGHLKPAQLEGEQMSPEQMVERIRQLQKENEYLKRQREILKKAMRCSLGYNSIFA
jgi:transposase